MKEWVVVEAARVELMRCGWELFGRAPSTGGGCCTGIGEGGGRPQRVRDAMDPVAGPDAACSVFDRAGRYFLLQK